MPNTTLFLSLNDCKIIYFVLCMKLVYYLDIHIIIYVRMYMRVILFVCVINLKGFTL